MVPQIDGKHFVIIRQIFYDILVKVVVRVYVFGSRAKNIDDKYSDLELAIDCYANNEMLPSTLLLKLAVVFENLLLSYEVDIVDLKKISKEFRSEIETDFIRIL
jgi:predicted nucleotidyltransferase